MGAVAKTRSHGPCQAKSNGGWLCPDPAKIAIVLDGDREKAMVTCRQHIANGTDELLEGHPAPERALIKMVRMAK